MAERVWITFAVLRRPSAYLREQLVLVLMRMRGTCLDGTHSGRR
jgi:hypothetical protein